VPWERYGSTTTGGGSYRLGKPEPKDPRDTFGQYLRVCPELLLDLYRDNKAQIPTKSAFWQPFCRLKTYLFVQLIAGFQAAQHGSTSLNRTV